MSNLNTVKNHVKKTKSATRQELARLLPQNADVSQLMLKAASCTGFWMRGDLNHQNNPSLIYKD